MRADNPERTIEELLGFSTKRLLEMSIEELKQWQQDSITRQDELLKSVPRTGAKPATKVGGANARETAKIQQAMAGLSPEMKALMDKVQNTLAEAKKIGLK